MVGQLRLDGLQPVGPLGSRSLVEVGFDLDVPRCKGLEGGRASSGCHISVRLSEISRVTQSRGNNLSVG